MGRKHKLIKPQANFQEEQKLWAKDSLVIGVDEVGRGCFAGPVVTAAVVFPKNFDQEILTLPKEIQASIAQINDSKLVQKEFRIKVADIIKQYALSYGISSIDVPTINQVGIGKATEMSFRKTIAKILGYSDTKILSTFKEKSPNILISQCPSIYLLIDGFHIKYIKGIGLKNQKAIVKGDQKSISIAAASILAKVYRDNMMQELDEQYPNYGFAIHKGYGTKMHQKAMKEFGLSKLHRTSFDLQKFL